MVDSNNSSINTQTITARSYWQRGEPFVWLTASALAGTTALAVAFIVIILANAIGFFWPNQVIKLTDHDGRVALGELVESKTDHAGLRYRVKVGNRDLYGQDFVWWSASAIANQERPLDVVVLERREYGNFYGFLQNATWQQFLDARAALGPDIKAMHNLASAIASINKRAETLRLEQARLEYRGASGINVSEQLNAVQAELAQVNSQLEVKQTAMLDTEQTLRRQTARFREINGSEIELPLVDIVRAWQPNRMSLLDKIKFYLAKGKELLLGEPRESNTEGGVFPAIFGTVMMVLIMSFFSIPLGVIAAIYLREYAKEGRFVALVRISVNNLAGVPSIVYGVFGLGFFIYTIGSSIDEIFYPHLLPTPTYGTGGILWASLTLALLTVPVVIVSTEEALSAIPKEIREGSLGLGATKFQTLVRILLPMSTPGILTGMILAMARAAGEVAPLMLTGAVKLAPELPLDSQFPFLHLDRKFMHLGFHIYDLGFQSPNVEAVLPMVYVTTTVLLGIVILLSAAAILLRNRMRKKYTVGVF